MGGMVGSIHGRRQCQVFHISKEILRNVTEQNPRIAAILNNLNEQAAERKMVSVLFIVGISSTEWTISLMDNFPHMRVATVSLREIKEKCEQAFQKPTNRTLERYKFFSRKQNP